MTEFQLDFIGVGAARAGTTWLSECLREHPQVCMSQPKELYYFCTRRIQPNIPANSGKGEDWLAAHFLHWQPGQIRGEISVGYLVAPESPVLIHERFPDAKIVVSYRNPVEALYSLYHHWGKEFPVPDTFEDFLQQYPDIIQVGYYYTHTKRYLEYFPLKNMHFILYDDIRDNPEKVLASLFRFLDIEADYRPSRFRERVNVSKPPRSTLLRDVIGSSRKLLNSNPRLHKLKALLVLLGVERLANWMYAVNLRGSDFPPMESDTWFRLTETYAEENLLLGELLSRDLSHWNVLQDGPKQVIGIL